MLISQVVYTNSNCDDIWGVFVAQNKKYTNQNLFAICDNKEFPIKKENIFLYSNNEPYYETWVNALNFFGVENFIYLQEDFILYDYVKDEKIFELTKILNNSNYSFIRLIKSGNLKDNKYIDNLYEIEPCNQDIFSMQATIWKTKDYINILENVKEKKWLETSDYRNFMCSKNICGLYYYNGEPKRGISHHDSSIYPYIATALVKGMFNISEYKDELSPLLLEYNLNLKKRAFY